MKKYVCIVSLQPSETCSTCCDSMIDCSKFRETANGKEHGTTVTALGHVLTAQPLNLAVSTCLSYSNLVLWTTGLNRLS